MIYPVVCPSMETGNFISENFPSLKMAENSSVKNKKLEVFLSGVCYLIKQLFHSRLLDMSLW